MRTTMISIIALVTATGGATAQAPGGRTVQQDFEAASALDDSKNDEAALAAWQALAKRVQPRSRNAAIIAVRQGDALFRLGRWDEANAMLKSGLAALPVTEPSLRADRTRGWLVVGAIAHSTLDYAGAVAAFAEAEKAADTPVETARATLALAQVATFVDPARAGAALDRASTALASLPEPNRDAQALVARRRAELKMNAGDFEGARTQALDAVRLLGGLTTRTTLDDVAARSDVALAYILAKKPEPAREYMAMTGAGRLPKGEFTPGARMQAPDCGGEADLKPTDTAVVQFAITDRGAVARVEPIYASGGGDVALEFARAVRAWSWTEDDVKAIPSFFRQNVRIEMRCSTAFARPSVGDGLTRHLTAWLDEKGAPVAVADQDRAVADLYAQRQALAQAKARDRNSLQTLGALWTLAENPTVPREERLALLDRARTIAAAAGAPTLARLAIDLPRSASALVDQWKPGVYDAALGQLAGDPGYAADPQARAAILLIRSDAQRPRDRDRAIVALLQPVADDTRLAKDDPLRVGALVRIASAQERLGDAVAARSAFASSGVTADQCAVLDAQPRIKSMPGSEAFPREAMQWGFEGWAQVQYDVKADGRTEQTRTLLAYPPFVFSKSAETFFVDSRFERTFRPDGAAGCGGMMQRIVFKMPG